MSEIMEQTLRLKVPGRLLAKLDAEARRQMISRSAMVRVILVGALGAADDRKEPGDPRQREVAA